MRLAVLAAADPLNVRTWSGTPYYMTKALQRRFTDLFPIRNPRPAWFRYLRRATRKATGERIELAWIPSLARWHAGQLVSLLKAERVNAVLSIGNAPLSAFIARSLPTIHVSDATAPLMRGYYQEFSRLPKSLADQAFQLDRASVRYSRACLYSTEWAANSALRDYGAESSRIHVIPWGCNIDLEEATDRNRSAAGTVCNLIFIGVDWRRKGGDIAVQTTNQLVAAGHSVKLHIIGATPDLKTTSNSIVVHGFINKGTPDGRVIFHNIMKEAAFLFMPTRQDCSPMVFAEANAYGLPVITTNTGGVSGVITDDVNGQMLPLDATPDNYATLIWSIWSDPERYARLSEASLQKFKQTLNWGSWLAQAAGIIERAAAEPASSDGPAVSI